MRSFTNQKLIARQSRLARYATFGGLAVLLGSLFLSFNTDNILIAYVALIVGFALSYVGSIMANRFIREPRGDHALERALKGFDNKHQLYNFVLPVSHVLLTPAGLLVFRIKSNDGAVRFDGAKWRAPFRLTSFFGGRGREPLGDPIRELGADIARLKQFLGAKMENAPLVPVDGYVVFTDPKVQLDVHEANVPVVIADNLKETLRKSKRGAPLSPPLAEQVQKILDEIAHEKTT